MRTLLRSFLISLLIASLVGAPAIASPSRALGVIAQAEGAHVGSGDAISGGTVFGDDKLTTDARGTLRVRMGATQICLLANSAAGLREKDGVISAALERGTLVFSSTGKEALELRVSEARIRPRAAQSFLGQVTLVGPYEFLVTSQRGQLDVTIGEENRVVPEATSYRVVIEPEAQSPQGAGSGKPPVVAARSRFFYLTLAAVAVGTGIGIWRALVSPDAP